MVSTLKAALRAWRTPTDQHVEIALRYLGGMARREVLVLNTVQQSTLQGVIQHLEGIYGDKTPCVTLMGQFYSRQQRPREDMRQYALCLQELLQRISTRFPGSRTDEDRVLSNRFVEGLASHAIKTELRKEVRKHATISFLDLKEEALQLKADTATEPVDEVVDAGLRQVKAPSLQSDLSIITDGMKENREWYKEMEVSFRSMQQQIMDLQQTIAMSLQGPRGGRRPTDQFTDEGSQYVGYAIHLVI
ncbi:hypothetical protein BSL78_00428 [Apostichopus japonicus]|uniref:Paraneoplastic antigen Ma-like C-terminal domain-containing protein n=1 Tax=Stichopus japonicus TaxID=307972 RepID=A0A2G8LQT9_STIJA|nr:hypothetical protein BSL78_00428 [Apostichopus japonicus]